MFDAQALRLRRLRRLLSGLCCRSDLLHCPACDKPFLPDVQNPSAFEEIDRGFVPLHRGCRLYPKTLSPSIHWKNEARKHRWALEAQQRLEAYYDWVEKATTLGSDLPHCPNCDLPFAWDDVSAQAQFEAGFVPGHPECSAAHLPLPLPEQRRELRRIDRVLKAS